MSDKWARIVPDPIGDDLLHLWADHNRWGLPVDMGMTGYMKERLDKAYGGTWPQSVVIVEGILCRIKSERKDYWRACKRYYLGLESPMEIASAWSKSEGYVRQMLFELSRRVAREYTHRNTIGDS